MLRTFELPKWTVNLIILTFLIGLLSRLLPVFEPEARLLEQFVTEDGYLMLTIARNISLGLGMSTADGTIPTNGTQPFTTFVWALGFFLTDSDKVLGVMFAHVVQVIVSIFSCYVLYLLASKVFSYSRLNREIALVVSALFFASPRLLQHSMNSLETGLFLLAILLVIYTFYESDEDAQKIWSIPRTFGVGFLLGWMFWVRIDSAFIILAACICYLYRGLPYGISHMKRRLSRVLIFGSTSVLISLPWLINNYIRFGSLTPISGQSQTGEYFAQNISIVPSILAEYLSIILPIPNKFQTHSIVIITCLVIVLIASYITFQFWKKAEHRHRSLIVMGLISLICYISYYGLFFGAQHFMGRYLAALAPFLILLTGACLIFLASTIKLEKNRLFFILSIAVVSVLFLLNARLYYNGASHQHFQVVNWVKQNVPEETWIGAIQTGTLGYYHDRTINLDGKVNPNALAARQGKEYCPESYEQSKSTDDCVMNYIIERELWYLVDWVGMVDYMYHPLMKENYSIIVQDSDLNLAVLKRHGAPEK